MSRNWKITEGEKELLEVFRQVLAEMGLSTTLCHAVRFFLRNPYESLIVVDKSGKIQFMDRGSEKFFNLPPGCAKGLLIKDVYPDSNLPKVLSTGVPMVGKVIKLKGATRIGSVFPLIKNGQIVGAIGRVIFRSLEELERVNRRMYILENRLRTLKTHQQSEYTAHYTFENILGTSKAVRDTVEMAKRVATIESDVLLTGESGTGKELFAQAIHNFSTPFMPFIRVNSPAIPFDLAESELFGYDRGSFTGAALTGKPGKFELANCGTLFLDEISALPLSIQPKLLRVIQEREVERLGGKKVQKVNFRLIAATNMDLKELVKEGRFREDLYYRIAKLSIEIPPLRRRKDDIPLYVEHYLPKINERFYSNFERLSKEASFVLAIYDWPGNVRELINVLEQAALKQWRGKEITLNSLPSYFVTTGSEEAMPSNKWTRTQLHALERDLIRQALKRAKGNKRRAAMLLEMPRSTLYKKIADYGLNV